MQQITWCSNVPGDNKSEQSALHGTLRPNASRLFHVYDFQKYLIH